MMVGCICALRWLRAVSVPANPPNTCIVGFNRSLLVELYVPSATHNSPQLPAPTKASSRLLNAVLQLMPSPPAGAFVLTRRTDKEETLIWNDADTNPETVSTMRKSSDCIAGFTLSNVSVEALLVAVMTRLASLVRAT